jgi:hypothetical protein
VAHRAVALEGAQRADLLEPRPVLVLEHRARRQLARDAADHGGCDLHREGERIVLQHERHVGADRLDRLPVIADDLVVGAQCVRRRDHHAGRALIHHRPRQRAHRGKARRGDADHHGQLRRAPDHLARDCHRLGVLELGCLAELAEHGDAGGSAAEIEVGQAVDRRGVDRAVVEEGRRCDGEDAARVGSEQHERFLQAKEKGMTCARLRTRTSGGQRGKRSRSFSFQNLPVEVRGTASITS